MRPGAWFRPITAIFFLALAILVFIGIQAYRDVRQLLDLQGQRHAALERQQSLDVLLLRLSDTESAQRGFVITGDASYLDAYEAVLRALAQDRRAVQDFFSFDPLQRERLARLDQAIARELDDLGRPTRLRKGTAGEGADQRHLPRQAAVAVPAPLAAPAAPSPAAGAETIMVVEDALPLRELACEFLRKAGYTVLEAPTGKEALAIAAQHNGGIHVLLTDVIMPGLSGPDLARELQALQPGLTVLFMSGYTDDAIVHHGVLEPGVNLLPKPFSRDQLLRKMREVLDKRTSRGQAFGA